MSLRTESSSPETVASCVSAFTFNDFSNDEQRSIGSLSRSNSYRNTATQALTGGENVVRVYTKSPHYLPLACLAMLMNPFLGIPACICSLISRKFRRDGNDRASGKFSKCALWLSVIAIAVSIVIIIFVIVYIMVIMPNIILNIKGLRDASESSQHLAKDDHLSTTTMTTVRSNI